MLKRFYPSTIVDHIGQIDAAYFREHGIKGLIIDIDNTLVGWDILEPDEMVMQWIEVLKEAGLVICLLSNNSKERVTLFNKNLKLHAIHKAGKPRKPNFLKALKLLKTKPCETAVIGDQIFTDIWGGNRHRLHTILVSPISKKEFRFIGFKRRLERIVLRSYHKNQLKKD
ncbi:MAG: YqeG family HAD IIIA-type phosphatase [Hyphomonadaceae bacterium]|nr:YqeG family HAD IIIA-type phosphatase [Clostridia bacterium]